MGEEESSYTKVDAGVTVCGEVDRLLIGHKKGEGRLGLTFFDISSASSKEKKTSELANKIYILTVHCILSCVFSNFIFGYKFVTDTVTQRQVDGDKYKV